MKSSKEIYCLLTLSLYSLDEFLGSDVNINSNLSGFYLVIFILYLVYNIYAKVNKVNFLFLRILLSVLTSRQLEEEKEL